MVLPIVIVSGTRIESALRQPKIDEPTAFDAIVDFRGTHSEPFVDRGDRGIKEDLAR